MSSKGDLYLGTYFVEFEHLTRHFLLVPESLKFVGSWGPNGIKDGVLASIPEALGLIFNVPECFSEKFSRESFLKIRFLCS